MTKKKKKAQKKSGKYLKKNTEEKKKTEEKMWKEAIYYNKLNKVGCFWTICKKKFKNKGDENYLCQEGSVLVTPLMF